MQEAQNCYKKKKTLIKMGLPSNRDINISFAAHTIKVRQLKYPMEAPDLEYIINNPPFYS